MKAFEQVCGKGRRFLRAAISVSALAITSCTPTPPEASATPSAPKSPIALSRVRLEDLTWTELRDAIKAGQSTAIIPVGGVEQSGPAIALGKHNARVAALSDQIARKLKDALVAPVVAYVPEGGLNPPSEHMRFPGTITVPREVFRATVSSAAQSLALHGFRTIALLGDHGGYQSDLKAVAGDLNRRWGSQGPRAVYVSDYYAASQTGYVDALKRRGFSAEEIGAHAGLADASLMLAVDPQRVRVGKMRLARPVLTEGVNGDPRRASAELGIVGVRLMVDKAVDQIRAAEADR